MCEDEDFKIDATSQNIFTMKGLNPGVIYRRVKRDRPSDPSPE